VRLNLARSFGIDGAEECRVVAKRRRVAACVVKIRGCLP
jgi:hypothetical protein